MPDRFDVVIVGAGPAGLAAGAQAARRGMRHCVLERGEFADTIHHYQRGKQVMAEPSRLVLHEKSPLRFGAGSREEVLQLWTEDIARCRAQIRSGRAHEVLGIEGQLGAFRIRTAGGEVLHAECVVLALGTQGNLRTLQVPGAELPHVSYQLDDPAQLRGKRVVVVGAGDSAIENALALAEHCEVALVNRRDEFDRAKTRNRTAIEAAIRRGDIEHLRNAQVRRIEPGLVHVQCDEGEVTVPADHVIARIGALPPRQFLEAAGIAFDSRAREAVPEISESYESNVPGLYLVGSLTGRPLIKSCLNDGYEVIEHIAGEPPVPADEPILREILGPLGESVWEGIDRIRTSVPLLAPLTPTQLREFLLDSVVHRRDCGELVFRKNDFSDSFWSILEGRVEVVLPHDGDAGSKPGAAKRPQLGPGEFFGELSLISGRRRSATIQVAADALLLESSRTAVQKLAKSIPAVGRMLDVASIVRSLADLEPSLDIESRRTLANASVIETYAPGQVLFREGDRADGLHLIRRGAVRIVRRRSGEERVLQYVHAGNYIGEVALLRPDGTRTATARAQVATETIRVPSEAILQVLAAHPSLHERFEERAHAFAIRAARVLENPEGSQMVQFLLDQGGKEATDLLVIDESLCIRCDNCEKACAETHQGVSRLHRESGARHASLHLPIACQHCENPRCMIDCPPDAIRRHENAEVYILDTCIGCGNCATNCPYDVIQMVAIEEPPRPTPLWDLLFGKREPSRRTGGDCESGSACGTAKTREMAVKCDLCRELPSRWGGEPRAACVASCPTGAIARVHPQDFIVELLGRR